MNLLGAEEQRALLIRAVCYGLVPFGLVLVASPVVAHATLVENSHTIEGYANKRSVAPGDTLTFYVHLPAGHTNYQVRYFRYGASSQEGLGAPQLVAGPVSYTNGRVQNYDSLAYQNGAQWQPSFSQVIPTSWTSGIYAAQLTDTTSGDVSYVTFIVKDASGSQKSIALVASTNTWAAYNFWPGEISGAFYDATYGTNCDDKGATARNQVSFLRPNPDATPLNLDIIDPCHQTRYQRTEHLAAGEIFAARWLQREGWPYSMLTDWDIDRNPAILDPSVYHTVIISTHSEYWSQNMYNAVQSYVARGGNLIDLSGNTAYYQVTLAEAGGNQTIAKVNPEPHLGGAIAQKWPHNTQLGLFGLAGYDSSGTANTCSPYSVLQPANWAFRNVPVQTGMLIGTTGQMMGTSPCSATGQPTGASGWEADRSVQAGDQMGVSSGFSVLARGTNRNVVPGAAYGEVVSFRRASAGQVFGVGSITFGQSLIADSYLSTGSQTLSPLVENVLVRFNKRSASDFNGDRFPDVLGLDAVGNIHLCSGNGSGGFVQNGCPVTDSGWGSINAVVPVGEFAGDGTQDVLARDTSGQMHLCRGNGSGGFIQDGCPVIDSGWNVFNAIIGVGDFNGDGIPDVLARDTSGQMHLCRGNGSGGFIQDGCPVIDSGWNAYTSIISVGDFAQTGHNDVLARDSAGNMHLCHGDGAGHFIQDGCPIVDEGGWNTYTYLAGVW
jgi:hypothetical protein